MAEDQGSKFIPRCVASTSFDMSNSSSDGNIVTGDDNLGSHFKSAEW